MTSLTATPQPGTVTVPPSMLLQVTGAPNPPAGAYVSNFAGGVDGWVDGGSATLAGNQTVAGTTTKTLRIQGPTTTADATAQRALTGLTVGTRYRYRATFTISRGEVKLVAKDTASGTVLAQTSFRTYAAPSNKTISMSLDFTPTAGAVTVQVVEHQTTAFGASNADVYAYNVSVTPLGTWLGTTIYRTDANGSDIVVREDVAGQDTSSGAMTVTDWEAALTGPVSYRVVDGSGATAIAVTTHATEVRRNLCPNPSFGYGLDRWSYNGGTGATDPLTNRRLRFTPDGSTADPYARFDTDATDTPAAGQSVTLSFDVAAVQPVTVRAVVNFRDAAGALVAGGGSGAGTSVPTLTPVKVSGTWAVPAGAVIVSGYVQIVGTPAASAVIYVDNVLLERGTTVGAFFDGDSPDTAPTYRSWSGAPGSSSSMETTTNEDLGAWLTLPSTASPSRAAAGNPAAVRVPMVLTYDASSDSTGAMQQVIGRSDKIGSPGPLSTRVGTMAVFELDYAAVRALRALLKDGTPAMLRQPSHPALDMYFVADRVAESMQVTEDMPTRWVVTIGYEEVASP